MYCRNCGKELDDKAVVCVGCGVPPLKGCKYCQDCGKAVEEAAVMCVSCGAQLKTASSSFGGEVEDKTWAMLAHLSIIILGFLGPLIIWLIKGKDSEFINNQGKEALNFGITSSICLFVSSMLTVIIIGALLAPVIYIYSIVMAIIAGMAANKGTEYKYPITFRFIK